MKVSKDALRIARQLMRLTVRTGSVDAAAARTIVSKVIADKPRNYHGILNAYTRLLRLELQKRHAVIESAVDLPEGERNAIVEDLKRKHGGDITSEFRTAPALLGGIRVQLGSTVWDGSVKARLETLRDKVLA